MMGQQRQSLWTNWFNPKKIADSLHYIPLDEEVEDDSNRRKERD